MVYWNEIDWDLEVRMEAVFSSMFFQIMFIALSALAFVILNANGAITRFCISLCTIPVLLAGRLVDWLHDKKVAQGNAQERLPWYLHWYGWKSESEDDKEYDCERSIAVDTGNNTWVSLVRRRARKSDHPFGS